MSSQGRLDWRSLILRIWKSRVEDKRRGSGTLWLPIGALLLIAFLAGSVTLWNSGHTLLGVLFVMAGLASVFAIWYKVSLQIDGTTGWHGGWPFDAGMFVRGGIVLAFGLFLLIDPLRVVPRNVYNQGNPIGVLGFATALGGLVLCMLSLRK
jgi:hypothetical protein